MVGGFVCIQSTLDWDGTKVSLLGSIYLLLLPKNLAASRFIKDIWEGVGPATHRCSQTEAVVVDREGLGELTLLQQPRLKIDFGKNKEAV